MNGERYFDWQGWRCFYQVAGEPELPPLVMIHGHATSHFTWRHQVAALQMDFQVFTPDLLGFGRSSKPRDVAYNVEVWTAQITDFIRSVVQRPVMLVEIPRRSHRCACCRPPPGAGLKTGAYCFGWGVKLLAKLAGQLSLSADADAHHRTDAV